MWRSLVISSKKHLLTKDTSNVMEQTLSNGLNNN